MAGSEPGTFTSYNMLVGERWTMGGPRVGAAELNLGRVVQVVSDVAGGSLDGLRVLDLAALEGMYGLELAARGADVVAVEGRGVHVANARWAARELGLSNIEIVEADVRSLADLGLGGFDVVLCLGIVYHLPAREALALLREVAACTRRAAVIEGQVSLRAREEVVVDAVAYHGATFPEPPGPWAAVGNPESFWFTRPSLLNALTHVGFTSVLETAVPYVTELDAYRDHVQLLALKGEPVELRLTPQVAAEPADRPERAPRRAHPDQGRLHRLADRVLELRGRGLASVFGKR